MIHYYSGTNKKVDGFLNGGLGPYCLLPSPGAAGSTSPSLSAISQWDWGFHIVRDSINPGDHHVRPRCVGFANVSKYC